MNSVTPHVSLRRSIRKNSTAAEVRPHSRSLALARRKTRPPPLQIIPELSENVLDISVFSNLSPATARPTQSSPQNPELNTSPITLSSYTFSIDHALLLFGDEAPRSPALSVSSSTSDCTSSDSALTTPRSSEDEDGRDCTLSTPRLCPRRISIRPLCISKTRSMVCQEDEDACKFFENGGDETTLLQVTEGQLEPTTKAKKETQYMEEEQDFYAHEFEDFISLSPVVPSPTHSARRDSLILVVEAPPVVIDASVPKPRGRSRHSKPLPLLPPTTPPFPSFPLVSTLPLVQTTAQRSIVRRKRNVPSLLRHLPSSPSPESRPLPRVTIPLDVEDCVFSEEPLDVPSRESIITKQIHNAENTHVCSPSSLAYTTSVSIPPLVPATSHPGMYGEVTLPRSSIDSNAPRSSADSTVSFAPSSSSDTPTSPFPLAESPSFEGPQFESMQCLRSRWSSSTLASISIESPRTPTLLSPLKSVLGSRARRAFLPPQKIPPKTSVHPTPATPSKNKQGLPTTTSPLSTLGKHLRRQKSRSSTSSTGTSSSECNSRDGSPSGLKRKPIPVAMFLRAT